MSLKNRRVVTQISQIKCHIYVCNEISMKTYNLAPEVIQGKKFVEQSQWWCFGCLLFQMLSGIVRD